MNALEKTIPGKMEKYLQAVRAVLKNNGAGEEEIADLLDNLRCHALETASRYMESMSLDDAINRSLASLEPPETYATHAPERAGREAKATGNYSAWLGMASAAVMVLALLVPAALSKEKLFDTPLAGTIFVFGELLALGSGAAAWPDIWAKAGALCSGLMLAFLGAAFLWVTFLKMA
jgi:hypothetical protein